MHAFSAFSAFNIYPVIKHYAGTIYAFNFAQIYDSKSNKARSQQFVCLKAILYSRKLQQESARGANKHRSAAFEFSLSRLKNTFKEVYKSQC